MQARSEAAILAEVEPVPAGETLSAQLNREQVEALELQGGQIVYVRPTRQTVFSD